MSDIQGNNLHGVVSLPRGEIRENDALQNFFFKFDNGDHHINRIALLKNDGNMRVAFKDKNDDDPWSFNATYVPVPGIEMQEVRGVLRQGRSRVVTISGLGGGRNFFALNGFEFRLAGNEADTHIFSISIIPNEGAGTVLLGFKDIDAGDGDVGFTIQFQLIPATRVTDIFEEQEDRQRRTFLNPIGAEDRRVLSGFSFNFQFSDHHLLQLGVNLRNGRIFFQDNNTDDRITWRVKYLVLR